MGTSAKWPCRPLKEIATKIGSGATPLGGKNTYKTEGVALIRSLNVYDFQFSDTDLAYIDEHQAAQLDHVTVQPNDILLNITGASVARCCIVNPKYLPARVNQHVAIVRISPDLADPLFVLYSINSPHLKRRLLALAQGGATREALTKATIEEFEIPLPPLPVQRRIAGVLGAYDELIEVNQRRIRILEQMARALYREWFVHFRFPGHEHVPRVPSPLGPIPKGWEVTTLGKQLVGLESGKRPKGGCREVVDGVPSIGAENINGIGRHDFASEKFVPREFFQQMRKGVVRDRDVAIYKDGAYIGKSSYFRDGFPHAECCVNEHVFLLRTNGVRLTQNALYLWLQEPATVNAIRATNANAAQPGVNQQAICGLELVAPDEKTARDFDRLVEPLLAGIINLAKQIRTLRRTRDLLLPRLMSGQVELKVEEAT